MDIKNIALVRATDAIPFDGIVHPVSNSPYLRKMKGHNFCYAINDLLKSQGLLEPMDYSSPEAMDRVTASNNQIESEYLPYGSYYNSMSLWSLNGLVPNDTNNVFSDKPCAIIDGLEEQIGQSEIISLMPTDTAVFSDMTLSNAATVLIRKDVYDSLSEQEIENLKITGLSVSTFEGSLHEAIDKNLRESGRYTSETLSLTREHNGYVPSETSEELLDAISFVAEQHDIPQEYHFNVVTGQTNAKDKFECVKNEFNNMVIIDEFYAESFFEYLFANMDIAENVKADCRIVMDSPVYMEALCDEIKRIGINEYKKVLDTYNKSLEQLRDSGQLPTPQQIVDAHRNKAPLSLNNLISQLSQNQQKENTNITMEELAQNALEREHISTGDVQEVDSMEEKERFKQNTKEGVEINE